jgi:reverse gyrase
MEQAEVSMEKIRYKGILYLRNGRVFELEASPLSLCVGIRKEGFLKCERRIRVRASPELGRYPVGRVRFFYRSEQLPHTEASLVRRMRETGIGRPSTYSKIVETILKRGYVARSGDGYLFPRPVGIEIHRFLTGRFQNLVSEERTRELEEKMDMVERGGEGLLRGSFRPALRPVRAWAGEVVFHAHNSVNECPHTIGSMYLSKFPREFLSAFSSSLHSFSPWP